MSHNFVCIKVQQCRYNPGTTPRILKFCTDVRHALWKLLSYSLILYTTYPLQPGAYSQGTLCSRQSNPSQAKQAHTPAHSFTNYGNFEISLICMFLNCGRRPGYPEETQAQGKHANFTQTDQKVRTDPSTLEVWGHGATPPSRLILAIFFNNILY